MEHTFRCHYQPLFVLLSYTISGLGATCGIQWASQMMAVAFVVGAPAGFLDKVEAIRCGADAYLRQSEKYAAVPVVFLTAEGRAQSRVEVIRAGGDDHLVKPVSPALLLSIVAARLERAQFLKSLLSRDGLTGLLNHSAFLEGLRGVLLRRDRTPGKGASLVLLDLDHFKLVNDRHGHPVGDRVLAALGALLRRRLRGSDLVGRLGGEEFAVILEDLTEEEAERLMNRLLEEFSATPHTGVDGAIFHVTFSAGVARHSPGLTADAWRQTADDALYAAKAAGRRRVTRAAGPADAS